MNSLGFSRFVLFFALAGEAAAVGLGDLRGVPALGERPEFEIEIHGEGREIFDPNCFRLRQPSDSDLPWLDKATFSVRKGKPHVLLVRGGGILREPVLQLAVHLACGHDVVREYTVLASPLRERAPVELPARATIATPEPVTPRPRAARPVPVAAVGAESAPRTLPLPEKRRLPKAVPDRLVLTGAGEVGEPSLRLATELFSWGSKAEAREAEREILRLEFRMLLALQDQAMTQLAAAEKLRNMEETLGELQKRSAEFTQQLEKGVGPSPVQPAPALPVDQPPKPLPAVVPPPAKPVIASGTQTSLTEWSLYGLVLGALLGVGGWLGWRNYRDRQQRLREAEYQYLVPEVAVDAKREDEWDEPGEVDLAMEPVAAGTQMQVDVRLDADEQLPAPVNDEVQPASGQAQMDSSPSIAAATVDEHFEANPVMELADIMLSFGRVKGAAQALQEFIDNNPQEAIQPWIRLMDIYRMAGMRDEFDSVARNLNQYFNVEVQQWDAEAPAPNRQAIDLVLGEEPGVPMVPPLGEARPESLEAMPRLMQQVVGLWEGGEVSGYLHQLLRDNRGGKRAGFTLPVVEEIIFLIELKETINKIEREAKAS